MNGTSFHFLSTYCSHTQCQRLCRQQCYVLSKTCVPKTHARPHQMDNGSYLSTYYVPRARPIFFNEVPLIKHLLYASHYVKGFTQQ